MRTFILVAGSILSCAASAENIIRTNAPVIKVADVGQWVLGQPVAGDWNNAGTPSCGQWLPLASEVQAGTSFSQSRTCDQEQQQSVTVSEVNTVTQAQRLVSETFNSRTIQVQESQQALGSGNFVEKYYVVRSASCFGSALGHSAYHCPNNAVLESSEAPYTLKYMYVSYDGAPSARFEMYSGAVTYSKTEQLRIEWMDAAGNVLRSKTYLKADLNHGIEEAASARISADDYNAAWGSYKIKMTARILQ